jgi:ribonuclease J
MYLDGNIGVSEDSPSIKERKNLSTNGYLEVTVLISNNGKIKRPIVSFKGIPVEEISETFIFDIEDEVANVCRTFSIQNKKQEENLIQTLKQCCRKIIKDSTGKKPYTTINIARI